MSPFDYDSALFQSADSMSPQRRRLIQSVFDMMVDVAHASDMAGFINLHRAAVLDPILHSRRFHSFIVARFALHFDGCRPFAIALTAVDCIRLYFHRYVGLNSHSISCSNLLASLAPCNLHFQCMERLLHDRSCMAIMKSSLKSSILHLCYAV